jgi:hypothetical protein
MECVVGNVNGMSVGYGKLNSTRLNDGMIKIKRYLSFNGIFSFQTKIFNRRLWVHMFSTANGVCLALQPRSSRSFVFRGLLAWSSSKKNFKELAGSGVLEKG